MIQEKIRQTIKERGLTNKSVANALGMKESNFLKFMNDRRNLTIQELDAAVEFLGLELKEKVEIRILK